MPQSLSLSQLQQQIKAGIDRAHPLPYWVTAEISELKVNYSGHCYLELVEKGGANHIPKAKVSAVIWRTSYPVISSYFRHTTGSDLAAGMKVLVRGVVSYHELYGLSLQISDIDPTYTLGDMERQRQQTILQLQQDGVYAMNREVPLPEVMQRVAVVSSRHAAGFQDFERELAVGPYRYEVTLFDAFMQGAGAEDSMIEALGAVAEQADRFDVLVLIRGGGSQSDLGCFDSYRLCSYLAQFPLPVVAGIGHDKDQSVADLVAAVSLKTPTAVAVYLKQTSAQFDERLEACRAELYDGAREAMGVGREQLQRMAFALQHRSSQGIERGHGTLGQLAEGVRRYARAVTQRADDRIDGVRQQLRSAARYALSGGAMRMENVALLMAQRANQSIEAQRGLLELLTERTSAHDPQRILDMGYALVRHEGRMLHDGTSLAEGSTIEITLKKQQIEATVNRISIWKNKR